MVFPTKSTIARLLLLAVWLVTNGGTAPAAMAGGRLGRCLCGQGPCGGTDSSPACGNSRGACCGDSESESNDDAVVERSADEGVLNTKIPCRNGHHCPDCPCHGCTICSQAKLIVAPIAPGKLAYTPTNSWHVAAREDLYCFDSLGGLERPPRR